MVNRLSSLSSQICPQKVHILSYSRTPFGEFLGDLSGISAIELGCIAAKGAINKSGIENEMIQQLVLGISMPAGLGQHPARQIAHGIGLDEGTTCFSIEKVCASSMKAVSIATTQIRHKELEVCLIVGTESMSNVPHYTNNHRKGNKLGDYIVEDGLLKDGLTDPYSQVHMGICVENMLPVLDITREQMDNYSTESINRCRANYDNINMEITPVYISKGRSVALDQHPRKVDTKKIHGLRPAFKKGGLVTAGNSPPLSDGAAAIIIVGDRFLRENGLESLGEIFASADASLSPVMFSLAPEKAIRKVCSDSDTPLSSIQVFEINEAFAGVALANIKLLGISPDIVNKHGGAVALGHPLGASGVRIISTLVNVMKIGNLKLGCAAICNGGGGATALLVQRNES